MKFRLKDLVENQNDIVSHLFFSSITREFVEKNRAKTDEEYENKTFNIQFLVDGEEFDIKQWLETFKEKYFEYLRAEAQELLAEKLSDRARDISNILEEIHSKVESLENSINWEDVLVKK